MKKISDILKNESKASEAIPAESEVVEWKEYYIPDQKDLPYKSILDEVSKIIDRFGKHTIYVGKTSKPYQRMTGSGLITENQDIYIEMGEVIEENKNFPPHNKPHWKNGYKKMYVICSLPTMKGASQVEKSLIATKEKFVRNLTKGGEGADGGAPYYIYAVVHESTTGSF